MKTKLVLFDLDGTLLPMDQDVFVKTYFKKLAMKLAPYGYEPEALINTVWKGTGAMVKNIGEITNEEAFWKVFKGIYGEEQLKDKPVFEEFYKNEFQSVKEVCGFNPKAAKTVKELKKRGYRLALATNPVFPAIATESRIRWAGLEPEDFEYYTTYENSCYCKPAVEYYSEILSKLDISPEECIMIGNDVRDDMIAQNLGMKVFLLTDCIINKDNEDISVYSNGSFDDILEFLK